jgi:hypothetical protein
MKQISRDGYRSAPEIIQQAMCFRPTIALNVANSRYTIRRCGGRRQQLVPMGAVSTAVMTSVAATSPIWIGIGQGSMHEGRRRPKP